MVQRARLAVAAVYESHLAQMSISVLLLLNFVLNIVQTEIEATTGASASEEMAFDIINDVFTGCPFALGSCSISLMYQLLVISRCQRLSSILMA